MLNICHLYKIQINFSCNENSKYRFHSMPVSLMCQSRVAPYLHRRVHETYNSRGGNFSKSEYIHHLFEETGGLRKNLVQTRIWSSEIAGSRSGNIFPYTFKQRIQLFLDETKIIQRRKRRDFSTKKGSSCKRPPVKCAICWMYYDWSRSIQYTLLTTSKKAFVTE